MKVMILRGLPGSGKSTFTRQYEGAVICSADHYFETLDGYKFNPSELPNAHAACFRKFLGALQNGHDDVIIVDNTNTTAWEISPYVAAAQAYGIEAEVVHIECDPEVAFTRQTHGVPRHAFEAMSERLNEGLPPFWKVRKVR